MAAAKEQIGTLAQGTFGTVLGPAFSIIGLSTQVSSQILAASMKPISLNISWMFQDT
jgi:hypothetical protein